MRLHSRLRRLPSEELTEDELREIRVLLEAAFGSDSDDGFTDEDWAHAVPGTHLVLDVDGEIVAFASVAERPIEIGGRPFRTGYVEAVATAPAHERQGFGTRVMSAVNDFIRERFELGALATGTHRFYERLGWRTWRGRSFVRSPRGLQPTPEEDGYIMVLLTGPSADVDITLPISCDWRPGDVW